MESKKKIYEALRLLGARANLKGYNYITYCLEVIYENNGTIPLTKELYPMVAEKFDTTPSRVERAIRTCIGDICDYTHPEILKEVLGECHNRQGELGYTNLNFLCNLYMYIKFHM